MQSRHESPQISLWIGFFLIIYNFTANLANDLYLPSMPELAKAFSTQASTLQLTMSAWFAGVSLPQLFFGPLTDRFGRRKVLLLGALLFLFATILCTTAYNVQMLIIARFLQGVGVSSLNVSTFSILADLYDDHARTRIMNKISMCGILAPLIGPLIGGYILLYCGWRMNFVTIFCFGLIGILGLWWKLPESNLYLNPFALNFRNIYKNYLLLFYSNGFLKNLIPYALLLGGLVAYLTISPFLIIDAMHVPSQYYGLAQVPIFSAFLVGGSCFSFIKSNDHLSLCVSFGLCLTLIASVAFIFLPHIWGETLWSLIIPMVIYALGFSLCGAVLVTKVMGSAVISKGSAAAFLGFSMALSCFLNSFLISLFYHGSITQIAYLISALSLLAACTYYLNKS